MITRNEQLNGHPANFEGDNGKLYLVRCYNCNPKFGVENWAMAVASGYCAWCGWPGNGGKMTPNQEDHLNQICMETDSRLRTKYPKGCAEHEGDLLDLTPLELVEESINECLDQLTYLLTLRKKLL